MQKLKKGDTVIVIAGKNKKQKGKILKIIGNKKVLVDGVNAVKKHQKPNPQLNIEGGIITRLHPIDISNVAIFNPETQKADKVGIKVVVEKESKKQHKVRYYKSNKVTIGE